MPGGRVVTGLSTYQRRRDGRGVMVTIAVWPSALTTSLTTSCEALPLVPPLVTISEASFSSDIREASASDYGYQSTHLPGDCTGHARVRLARPSSHLVLSALGGLGLASAIGTSGACSASRCHHRGMQPRLHAWP